MANIDDEDEDDDKEQESEEVEPPKRKMIATLKVKVTFSVSFHSFSGSKSYILNLFCSCLSLFALYFDWPCFQQHKAINKGLNHQSCWLRSSLGVHDLICCFVASFSSMDMIWSQSSASFRTGWRISRSIKAEQTLKILKRMKRRGSWGNTRCCALNWLFTSLGMFWERCCLTCFFFHR